LVTAAPAVNVADKVLNVAQGVLAAFACPPIQPVVCENTSAGQNANAIAVEKDNRRLFITLAPVQFLANQRNPPVNQSSNPDESTDVIDDAGRSTLELAMG
jgi:hypothetical protein